MNFFKKIKKEDKTLNVAETRVPEIGEQAFRDWRLMLLGFAVLVILVVVADGYLFIKINSGDFFAAEPVVEINRATSNRKTLIDVNNFFESRQKAYEAFLNGTTTEIDPSL